MSLFSKGYIVCNATNTFCCSHCARAISATVRLTMQCRHSLTQWKDNHTAGILRIPKITQEMTQKMQQSRIQNIDNYPFCSCNSYLFLFYMRGHDGPQNVFDYCAETLYTR